MDAQGGRTRPLRCCAIRGLSSASLRLRNDILFRKCLVAGQSGTSSLTTDNAIVINSNRADHPFLRGLDTGYCCNMLITSVSKDEGAPTLAGDGGCPLAQVPGNSRPEFRLPALA